MSSRKTQRLRSRNARQTTPYAHPSPAEDGGLDEQVEEEMQRLSAERIIALQNNGAAPEDAADDVPANADAPANVPEVNRGMLQLNSRFINMEEQIEGIVAAQNFQAQRDTDPMQTKALYMGVLKDIITELFVSGKVNFASELRSDQALFPLIMDHIDAHLHEIHLNPVVSRRDLWHKTEFKDIINDEFNGNRSGLNTSMQATVEMMVKTLKTHPLRDGVVGGRRLSGQAVRRLDDHERGVWSLFIRSGASANRVLLTKTETINSIFGRYFEDEPPTTKSRYVLLYVLVDLFVSGKKLVAGTSETSYRIMKDLMESPVEFQRAYPFLANYIRAAPVVLLPAAAAAPVPVVAH